MHTQDYKLLVRVIQLALEDEHHWLSAGSPNDRTTCVTRVANRLADELAKDNPLFERNVFLFNCGVESLPR